MIKMILAVAYMTFIATVALAAPVSKYTFGAISSPDSIECAVFGMSSVLKKDANSSAPIQGFSPDTTYSRTLSLGTAGFASYSTVYGTTRLTAMRFTCRKVGTADTVPVKVWLNGITTHFLTTGSDEFVTGY